MLVAISEGIKDKNGVYISESVQSGAVDTFGHSYIAGSARVLEEPYQVRFTGIPVCSVANQKKKVPEDYINAAGNDVTEKMMSYLRPLIQGEAPVIYKNGIPAHLILY